MYTGAIDYRKVIKDILRNACSVNSVGAEIGVSKGISSIRMLECTNNNGELITGKLYLVDPWKRYPRNKYLRIQYKQKHHDSNLKRTKQAIAEFSGRYKIVREESLAASYLIKDPLDYVFIDANHVYKHVIQDLNLWFPKLKPGGLCFGHDWVEKVKDPRHAKHYQDLKGVTKAVKEFSKTNIEKIDKNALDGKDYKYKYHKDNNGVQLSQWTYTPLTRIWMFIKK